MPSRPRLRCFNKRARMNLLRSVVAWAQLIVCWLSSLGTESLPALPDDAPPGVDAPSPLPRPLWPCCRCRLSIACHAWVYRTLVDSCTSCPVNHVTSRYVVYCPRLRCRVGCRRLSLPCGSGPLCLRICVRVEPVILSLLLALPATALLSLSLFPFPTGLSARG